MVEVVLEGRRVSVHSLDGVYDRVLFMTGLQGQFSLRDGNGLIFDSIFGETRGKVQSLQPIGDKNCTVNRDRTALSPLDLP